MVNCRNYAKYGDFYRHIKTKIDIGRLLLENSERHPQEDYRKDLGGRLSQAIARVKNKGDAALAAGVSTEQLNKWVRGEVKVPAEGLRALAEYTRVDFSWLVTGQGAMLVSSPADQLRRTLERIDGLGQRTRTSQINSDFVRLPFFREVAASAGPGALAVSEQSDSVIAFARSFLRDHGAVPDRCSIIRAKGDSMAPTIPDASLLVVDHSQAEISNGCIMVVSVGDDLLVKRVRRRLDGQIDLISDNPAYPPETLQPAALQQLRVVGRVVYFCRTP